MNAHVMNVMDTTGHSVTRWDADDPVGVAAAKALFDSMTAQGYNAFRVTYDGKKEKQGERLREFDPTAEEIMLVPQLKGG